MIKKNCLSKGFSLIELLVTTVIVGILASVSMANYQTYREKAYEAQLLSATRNAVIALNANMASDIHMNYTYRIGNILPNQTPSAYTNSLVPGMPRTTDVYFLFHLYGNNYSNIAQRKTYYGHLFHCKTPKWNNGSVNTKGYSISTNGGIASGTIGMNPSDYSGYCPS